MQFDKFSFLTRARLIIAKKLDFECGVYKGLNQNPSPLGLRSLSIFQFRGVLVFCFLSVGFGFAHGQNLDVPLKTCSPEKLVSSYYFKSLQSSNVYYERALNFNEQARRFVENRRLDKDIPMSAQLSVADQLSLNSILEKINSYDARINIEQLNFRNLAILVFMIQVIRDDNVGAKDFALKNPKATALLVSAIAAWNSRENNLQAPFYENKNPDICNIYTLSEQIQREFYSRVSASNEEIQSLIGESAAIIGKVEKDGGGLRFLTPSEKLKYNRIKDIFPKVVKYEEGYGYLERVKALAYVSDLKYQSAVEVWDNNLGDLSPLKKSLQAKFSANEKYAKDFKIIADLLSDFERDFPFKAFYVTASRHPTEIFKK
jgi:hypothetical protein